MSAPCERALHADEIGLETVRFCAYRLKSLYQPVFRIGTDDLIPAAVEARALPHLENEPIRLEEVNASLTPDLRDELNALSNLMHIGNHHHLQADGIPIHLSFEASLQYGSAAVDHLALIFARTLETGLALPSLVCSLEYDTELGLTIANEMVETMRLMGVRIAIDGIGPSESVLDAIDWIQPDVVKFDAAWFRRVSSSPPAVRLLTELVERLKASGADVMVKGLEKRAQLSAAMSVGVDLVQGDLLAKPQHAGIELDMRPLEIKRIFRDPQKVIISLEQV